MKKMIPVLLLVACLLSYKDDFAQVCTVPNSLISVSKQNVPGFRKIIFTFKKPMASNFSVSAVTTTNGTYTTGDGIVHTLAGCHFKKITFNHVEWMCSPTNNVVLDSRIKAVKITEQFEGKITYKIGFCTSYYSHKTTTNTATQRIITLWFHN